MNIDFSDTTLTKVGYLGYTTISVMFICYNKSYISLNFKRPLQISNFQAL